jgi:hypothetical protein
MLLLGIRILIVHLDSSNGKCQVRDIFHESSCAMISAGHEIESGSPFDHWMEHQDLALLNVNRPYDPARVYVCT